MAGGFSSSRCCASSNVSCSHREIADRLGKRRAFRDAGELSLQPAAEGLDKRLRPVLPDGLAIAGAPATDLVFNGVERGDALQRLCRDRRIAVFGEIIEQTPEVPPAIGEEKRTSLASGPDQLFVGDIAVDLQRAGEACEMAHGVFASASRRVHIGDGRRIGSTPGPDVSGDGPEIAGLGLAAARIEHGAARLVGKELSGALEDRDEPIVKGPELEGGEADPVGERSAIDRNPSAVIICDCR